jgi:hypothetical protein
VRHGGQVSRVAANRCNTGDLTPLVAAVYRDVRRRLPFVPAFLKALARVDDEALEEAWLQARALFDDPRTEDSAARLWAAADAGLAYTPSPTVRAAVAPFANELPTLLLVITSLSLTLEGRIPAGPKPAADLPSPGPLPEAVPEERGEHPLFEEICRVYGTTYVPSMYRGLAAAETLEEPWRAIGPYLDSAPGRTHVAALARVAEQEAEGFPEVAYLRAQTARPVLAQFRRALPRNLVFAVAASATGPT